MRNYFTLDGVASTTHGVYISGQGTFSAPKREYTVTPIPGRNGDLILDGKRFSNSILTYPAFIYSNFATNIQNLRNWLLSLTGYKKLVDTYNPDEFRMVLYEGAFEPEVLPKNDAGSFEISFNCKPQRFLTSGETKTTLNASGSITNPTKFAAQPLLRVYGTGILGIGSQSITISQADTYTDIDCEMMDCFKGAVSKNAYVSLSGHNFPTLAPGENNISLGTGITKVEITPRWWRI